MSEIQAALVKASRALDAHFRLADDVKPLREAIGDALDIEKVLTEQRQQRDVLASDINRLKADKAKADEQRAASVKKAESDAVAIRSAAESWAADTRTQADRILIEAKDKQEEAGHVLANAALQASAMVADAKAEAAKIASGKGQEIADLDAAIAGKRAELSAMQGEIEEASDKLVAIQREIAAVKARLG